MASGAPTSGELTPGAFSAAVSAITNAFGDPTRREIYLFVRDASAEGAPGVTATEVAEHFALHPNVARHHLEKLTGGGYVSVAVWRQAAPDGARPAGRPSKRYRATEVDDRTVQLGLRDASQGFPDR